MRIDNQLALSKGKWLLKTRVITVVSGVVHLDWDHLLLMGKWILLPILVVMVALLWMLQGHVLLGLAVPLVSPRRQVVRQMVASIIVVHSR